MYMENIRIEKFLDQDAFSLYHQIFNECNGCHWTKEQFKQSLKNQPYLNFLVFRKDSNILGIVSYSTSNPWNKKIFDIEYSSDAQMTQYMISYKKKVVGK